MHEYHTLTKGTAGPIARAKSCPESAPALGRYTYLSRLTYTHANYCSRQASRTHTCYYNMSLNRKEVI